MLAYNIVVTSRKASVVDSFDLKPYWVGRMTICLIKNEFSPEYINFFRILDHQDKTEIEQ